MIAIPYSSEQEQIENTMEMDWTSIIIAMVKVEVVIFVSLFLLYPIISNYRKEIKCRRKYVVYNRYYK